MIQLIELYTLLDGELDHCLLLTDVLLSERKLIESRELDKLPRVLRQKADVLAVVESGYNQRISWLKSVRLPISYTEFVEKTESGELNHAEPGSSDSPNLAKCIGKWQELNQAKETCNKHNTVNGIIIAKAKKRNGQQLEILKGINPGKKLYDAKGQTIATNDSNKTHIA